MSLSNIALPLNSYDYISMKYMCKYRYNVHKLIKVEE